MKAIVVIALLAVVSMAGTSFAGSSCCGAKKKSQGAEMSQCGDIFASMNLTDEQKAKISELETACKAEGSSKESCAKYKDQMRDLLTDEQKAQFDEACAAKCKKSGASCDSKKSDS